MKAFLLLFAFAAPAVVLSALAAWAGCGPAQPPAAAAPVSAAAPAPAPGNLPAPPVPPTAPVPPAPPAADPLVTPPPPTPGGFVPQCPAAPQPPSAPQCPACAPGAVNGVVDSLAAILKQTKSKDVFAATVLALGQLGAEARPALPDILKNAERLGVLEGAFAPGGSKSVHGEVVLEAVAAIAGGKVTQPVARCCGAACPAVGAPGPAVPAAPAVKTGFAVTY